jgi:hypothetical protein
MVREEETAGDRGGNGRGINGDVSSGGVKPEVEEDPDEWVPLVSGE